ncbi:RNA polymerase sigma-70 factor, ECF subfamily [Mariniphaga anaerophila]|uniref:RNA polymerase sigma-70 factor, ECF subfamily n=1 Tax=Mariniphaga anaerophila TaxID=1484053 RepID=A0A1M4SVD3_9BACT|nr:sigma-70 family RNA polymerase sigma factor [Mariniphaga anaerophila]SHE36149.1 RNA polymerase sigma-70 factor, ECF subfamily [Mariniphaga anaerophila]
MDLKRTIKLCLKRDEQAFKKLYNHYISAFWGITRRYTASPEETDDIVQEAFIKIFNNLNQLRDIEHFEAWAKRIIINTALHAISNKNNSNIDINDYKPELPEEDEPRSLTAMDNMGISELIGLMDHLPAGYKTILNLYAVEEFSHKEIGKMLNIKEATSRSQYFKAKKAFQKILVEHNLKSHEQYAV